MYKFIFWLRADASALLDMGSVIGITVTVVITFIVSGLAIGMLVMYCFLINKTTQRQASPPLSQQSAPAGPV